ncbi:FBD-associated F-box protein At5g38590-like [Mercurialis annua]|uniref:FBD-associated F-box protein At5g38590-like n=1 Tax=Mercurialis annua TaxID=3986 RepID=UPI0024AF65CD|nr:FBD-associated F-box protein At5g38590-like [Mercurialis annua]
MIQFKLCKNKKTDNAVDANYSSNDYISKLPNDILISILSQFDLQIIARTSILSKRWRHIWKLCDRKIDINLTDFIKNYGPLPPLSSHDKLRIVDRMHNLLTQISDINLTMIDQLKIRFPIIGNSSSCDYKPVDYYDVSISQLQSWINMAIQNNVKALELDLSAALVGSPSNSTSITVFSDAKFMSLVSLRLIGVQAHLSYKLLDYLLSVSPFLEDLCVKESCFGKEKGCLGELKISDTCLKRLDLINNGIQILEISSAPNLESFKFVENYGKPFNVCFKNVPRPSRVSFE